MTLSMKEKSLSGLVLSYTHKPVPFNTLLQMVQMKEAIKANYFPFEVQIQVMDQAHSNWHILPKLSFLDGRQMRFMSDIIWSNLCKKVCNKPKFREKRSRSCLKKVTERETAFLKIQNPCMKTGKCVRMAACSRCSLHSPGAALSPSLCPPKKTCNDEFRCQMLFVNTVVILMESTVVFFSEEGKQNSLWRKETDEIPFLLHSSEEHLAICFDATILLIKQEQRDWPKESCSWTQHRRQVESLLLVFGKIIVWQTQSPKQNVVFYLLSAPSQMTTLHFIKKKRWQMLKHMMKFEISGGPMNNAEQCNLSTGQLISTSWNSFFWEENVLKARAINLTATMQILLNPQRSPSNTPCSASTSLERKSSFGKLMSLSWSLTPSSSRLNCFKHTLLANDRATDKETHSAKTLAIL